MTFQKGDLIIVINFYPFKLYFFFKFCRKNVRGENKMKENILIFTKLFLIMGILWGFEIVSLHVHSSTFSMLFGILNISRGSFMFIIFILKTSVFNDLRKRFENNEKSTFIATRNTVTGMKTETSFCDTEL